MDTSACWWHVHWKNCYPKVVSCMESEYCGIVVLAWPAWGGHKGGPAACQHHSQLVGAAPVVDCRSPQDRGSPLPEHLARLGGLLAFSWPGWCPPVSCSWVADSLCDVLHGCPEVWLVTVGRCITALEM